jgi:copper chaperone CopZ
MLKTYITGIVAALFLLFSNQAEAQNQRIDTAKFFVDGVCDMCKERIENAAYQRGVKFVEWDKYKKEVTVIYKTKRTSVEKIKKNILAAGHDAGDKKAKKENYMSIDECCRYRELETH